MFILLNLTSLQGAQVSEAQALLYFRETEDIAMDYTQPLHINSDIMHLFSWYHQVALSASFCPGTACSWMTYGTISTLPEVGLL